MATLPIPIAEDASIVVITGANTGLGLEVVKALLQSDRQYVILLGGRDLAKARAAAREAASVKVSQSTVESFQIDVEDDASIVSAYEGVASRYLRIDCLINNAGDYIRPLCTFKAL